jgi:uncharacterized membrane protein
MEISEKTASLYSSPNVIVTLEGPRPEGSDFAIRGKLSKRYRNWEDWQDTVFWFPAGLMKLVDDNKVSFPYSLVWNVEGNLELEIQFQRSLIQSRFTHSVRNKPVVPQDPIDLLLKTMASVAPAASTSPGFPVGSSSPPASSHAAVPPPVGRSVARMTLFLVLSAGLAGGGGYLLGLSSSPLALTQAQPEATLAARALALDRRHRQLDQRESDLRRLEQNFEAETRSRLEREAREAARVPVDSAQLGLLRAELETQRQALARANAQIDIERQATQRRNGEIEAEKNRIFASLRASEERIRTLTEQLGDEQRRAGEFQAAANALRANQGTALREVAMFRFCNNSRREVSAAFSYRTPWVNDSNWIVEHWYVIRPGDCHSFSAPVGAVYYFAHSVDFQFTWGDVTSGNIQCLSPRAMLFYWNYDEQTCANNETSAAFREVRLDSGGNTETITAR